MKKFETSFAVAALIGAINVVQATGSLWRDLDSRDIAFPKY